MREPVNAPTWNDMRRHLPRPGQAEGRPSAEDAVLRGIHALHRLALEGRDDSPEADAIRDATDAPWRTLSEAQRRRLWAISEALYATGAPQQQRPNNGTRAGDARCR